MKLGENTCKATSRKKKVKEIRRKKFERNVS